MWDQRGSNPLNGSAGSSGIFKGPDGFSKLSLVILLGFPGTGGSILNCCGSKLAAKLGANDDRSVSRRPPTFTALVLSLLSKALSSTLSKLPSASLPSPPTEASGTSKALDELGSWLLSLCPSPTRSIPADDPLLSRDEAELLLEHSPSLLALPHSWSARWKM